MFDCMHYTVYMHMSIYCINHVLTKKLVDFMFKEDKKKIPSLSYEQDLGQIICGSHQK